MTRLNKLNRVKIFTRMLREGVMTKEGSQVKESTSGKSWSRSSEEKVNETFQSVEHDYKESSEMFDPLDLEFEKFPQLNQDYMNYEHKLMSSDENIEKKSIG